MFGSGGYAVTRTRGGGDRFYSPPAVRRPQQLLQQAEKSSYQQQQQAPRQVMKSAVAVAAPATAVVEAENRTDSDESASTFSKPPSVGSSSPPRQPSNSTNLDRLMESVTPLVRAEYQVNSKGRRTLESDMHPYYCLEDLWETFREWSVYGAGVPLLVNGEDSIMQYYVPYLSGIQLYSDPAKPASKLSNGQFYYYSEGSSFKFLKLCGAKSKYGVIAYIPSFISLKDVISGENVRVLNINSRSVNEVELQYAEENGLDWLLDIISLLKNSE